MSNSWPSSRARGVCVCVCVYVCVCVDTLILAPYNPHTLHPKPHTLHPMPCTLTLVYTQQLTRSLAHTHTHTHTHTHAHTHTYTRIHVHTNTHVHTRIQTEAGQQHRPPMMLPASALVNSDNRMCPLLL